MRTRVWAGEGGNETANSKPTAALLGVMGPWIGMVATQMEKQLSQGASCEDRRVRDSSRLWLDLGGTLY